MAAQARERMIGAAARMLASRGPDGTSFRDVLIEAEAPRGSLYHYFPRGKEELLEAALAAAGERSLRHLDALAGKDALEVAEAFLASWRALLVAACFEVGCAVAAVTASSVRDALQERTAEILRSWRTRLGELLAAGGVPADRAPALAASLVAASEGAVILARAERSLEPFDLVAAEQLRGVRAALGR